MITINKLLKSGNKVQIKHVVSSRLCIDMCSGIIRAEMFGCLQIYFGLLSCEAVALHSTPELSFISK